MILLDTHVWIWWVDGNQSLPANYHSYIQTKAIGGLGVSAISCWEIAKLVQLGRLQLRCSVDQWLTTALQSPVQLLPLSPDVAAESARLPGTFHRDPADQIIVATARIYNCPLLTLDGLIRNYPHVLLAP